MGDLAMGDRLMLLCYFSRLQPMENSQVEANKNLFHINAIQVKTDGLIAGRHQADGVHCSSMRCT